MENDDLGRDHESPVNERLTRDGGALVEANDGTDVVHEVTETGSTQDDVAEDVAETKGHPGTVDDVPYSLGTYSEQPADQHLVPEGGTHPHGKPAPPTEAERDLGAEDEAELWRQQRDLIREDEDDGIKLTGYSDDEAERVMDAMGDEALEPLPDWPEGTSATGSVSTPDHGGFPERSE